MSLLRRLKGSKHFLKKGDTFLSNIDETTYSDLNQRDLIVYHIDSETEGTFSLTVKNDDTGENVLDRVCDHYNLHNYKEYFGLKYTLVDDSGDHEILWLDSSKSVGKQLKDTNNVLTFRVKHFPGKPQSIESEYVRYLIFLQIRNYLLKGDLQLSLAEDIKLAAYAVQASLGDYDPTVHKGNYLADIKFLSRKSIKAEEKIMEMHQKELVGKTPADMELAFLELASQFDTYGAELIVVKTSKGVPINFGVSHNGIITYLHGTPANIAKIDMFPWSQIGKISYEHRTLKVHFHTPDRENSEIIKKQVMVFKCNNSRVCKHLWKFILDQKAFFNFKRGVDVPKIKSSSRLFTFKSKFRFSGRCERELIQAQQSDSSICSNSGSMDTSHSTYNDTTVSTNSTAFNSLNRSANMSDHSSSTIGHTESSGFKRRTFQPTTRSFIRPKPHLEPMATNSSQDHVDSNETKSSKLDSKLDTQNVEVTEPVREVMEKIVVDVDVDAQAQATSTPTMMHKVTGGSDALDGKRISEISVFKAETETNEHNQIDDGSKPPFVKRISEGEDVFYEHDHYKNHKPLDYLDNKPDTNKIPDIPEEVEPKAYYATNNIPTPLSSDNDFDNKNNPVQTKRSFVYAKLKSLSCSLLVIFSVLFIFFFFLMLIEHWKCTSSPSIINKSRNAPNCNYQKTLNHLRIGVEDIMSNLFNTKKTLFSWSADQESIINFDPFFEWFSGN